MQDVLIRRVGPANWQVAAAGSVKTVAGLANDAINYARQTFDDARIGVFAADIGPATAIECRRQGYGEWLWLKR